MELDVTDMVNDADAMPNLSGSRAELGQDAGRITWGNSVVYAREKPLLATDAAREAARDHLREYGAWSRKEIDTWSETELQGIIVQDVAAAIRELDLVRDANGDIDIARWEQLCEQGTISGRLGRGDNGRWYFYLGI